VNEPVVKLWSILKSMKKKVFYMVVFIGKNIIHPAGLVNEYFNRDFIKEN